MKTESTICLVLFLLGGLALIWKGTMTERGLGVVYVKPSRVDAQQQPLAWTNASSDEDNSQFSVARTAGLWIAALKGAAEYEAALGQKYEQYRDPQRNAAIRRMVVGVSAGYFLVAGFWDSIVAQLMVKLTPKLVQAWALPGNDPTEAVDRTFLVPLILSVFLFCRFVPGIRWLARWPLAFVVGTFAGLRLVLFLDADFINQIRNTIVPLIVFVDGSFSFWLSLRNLGLILSLLSCLAYFYFSVPHQGLMGRTARVGIWVLMITFGASFAFTVMGRITLLTKRFEFLFVEWLRLIDP
ncbi:MAG: hypothetical protein B7Z55_04600 [Planctomycetales bacterium 12-60-4]|nr:MAG: hypothetical protein B7Z55_04600 [Planctomycetales bacterium 12-60-4]